MARFKHNVTLDEFAEFLCSDRLGPDLGKVSYKFIRSMLIGIHRSRSVNLTDVARGLQEGISLHATQKRLSRNLDNPDLTASLSDRLLQLGAANVGPDTRLIVHYYEHNKVYPRMMEYVPGPLPTAGFKFCEILASDTGSENYMPLLATVWSDKMPGYVSDAEEIKKAVRRVRAAIGFKNLLYFEDEGLPGSLLLPIIEDSSFDFITLRLSDETEVLYRNQTCRLQELLERVETRYGKMMFKLIPEGWHGAAITDLDLFIHVGAVPIKLPQGGRPLSLIALKSKSFHLGEIATPLITSRTNLRSRKALMGLVESYLSVQDVVLAHRTLRDSFNPASFRVLTFRRLQLLVTLLQAVIHYETSMAGSVSIGDRTIALEPHGGQLDRTYLRPGRHEG
jgi:hypothetical protein